MATFDRPMYTSGVLSAKISDIGLFETMFLGSG
jgi:hypothetical protein